jgi:superfamily II DNA helicase RecQ
LIFYGEDIPNAMKETVMFQTLAQIAKTYDASTACVEEILHALGIIESKRAAPAEQYITHGIVRPVTENSGKVVDYLYNIEPIKEEFEAKLSESMHQSIPVRNPGAAAFSIESTLSKMLGTLNEALLTQDLQSLYRIKADIADIYAHLPSTTARPIKKTIELDAAAEECFERLRSWRNATAKKRGVPPYAVLTNTVLRAIAFYRPASKEELLTIKGFGKKRAERYADEILKLLSA